MKQLHAGMTQRMMRVNPDMPQRRAERKARNTIVGIALLVMGAVAFFAGLGLMVVPFVVMKEHPGTWLLAFGAVVVTFGFVLVTLGARAISDDALDENVAPSMIVAIGKSIGLARGKTLDG